MGRHVTQILTGLLHRRRRAAEPTAVVTPETDYFARAREANPVLYAQWDAPAEDDSKEMKREREEALRAFYLGTEDDQHPS